MASENWAKNGFNLSQPVVVLQGVRGGNMRWKGRQVRLRHGSYHSVDCYIDGELVSEYRFNKTLETFEFPQLTYDEQRYITERQKKFEEEIRTMKVRHVRRRRGTNNSLQL